jgi:exosortase
MLRNTAIALLAVAGVVMFGFMGNTHEPGLYGPSVVSWLVNQWRDPGSESGHGWLIPLVSVGYVWQRRHALKGAVGGVCWGALAGVLVAMGFYWAGVRCEQPRLNVISLILLTGFVPYYLAGWRLARLLVFPTAYLVFMVPLGFLTAFTFPLRMATAIAAEFTLNGLGVACERIGTAILSVPRGGFALDVDDPCSGLRSLLALLALTVAYGALMGRRVWHQGALWVGAVPIAMGANGVRIVTLALVAVTLGQEVAMRLYHDYSGYLVFVVEVLFLIAWDGLLLRVRRRSAP